LWQVVVTSHSPDLLDDPGLDPSAVVAVEALGGVSRLARPDSAGRSALQDRLFTAGELLRVNQLTPDHTADIEPSQLDMFEAVDA
jgi:hypothetical protein